MKAEQNEEDFFKRKEFSQIFSGKGYVRASSIDSSGAVLQVYSKDLSPLFINTAASQNPQQASGLQQRSAFRLTKGSSKTLSFGYSANPLIDTFQVTLNDIVTPEDYAEFEFTVNGKVIKRKVNINQRLTPGSDWILERISITTSQNQADAGKKSEYPELTKGTEISSFYETTYKAVIRNSLNERKEITRKSLTEKDGKEKFLDIQNINEESAKAIENEFCKYKTEGLVYEFVSSSLPENELICHAVVHYRNIIEKYPESREALLAKKDMFEIYHNHIVRCLPKNVECENNILSLEKFYSEESGVPYEQRQLLNLGGGEDYLDDMGVGITLLRTKKITNEDKGSFSLRVYRGQVPIDIENININSNITKSTGINDDKTLDLVKYRNFDDKKENYYKWAVERINPGSVAIKLYDLNKPDSRAETMTLPLNQRVELPLAYEIQNKNNNKITQEQDSIQVEVTAIKTNTEAYITVLPGSTRGYTESSFILNIPVDPRPFKWTPEMLNSHINATTSIIEALDSMITKLDDVVSTWKKVCLGTFAFLLLKSSLLQGTARAHARRLSSELVQERCQFEVPQKAVSERPDFSTADECVSHYSDDLTKITDLTEKSFEDANEKLK